MHVHLLAPPPLTAPDHVRLGTPPDLRRRALASCHDVSHAVPADPVPRPPHPGRHGSRRVQHRVLGGHDGGRRVRRRRAPRPALGGQGRHAHRRRGHVIDDCAHEAVRCAAIRLVRSGETSSSSGPGYYTLNGLAGEDRARELAALHAALSGDLEPLARADRPVLLTHVPREAVDTQRSGARRLPAAPACRRGLWPAHGDHERMIYGCQRAKGAPLLGARPGQDGPFGRWPEAAGDETDTGEPAAALVPAAPGQEREMTMAPGAGQLEQPEWPRPAGAQESV